ncbi:hypothetical protein LCGC14_0627800 [marine sediment metagenome]|uniref:Uncharacterized protein n=1 Tax=marine sediment metagenome TaxID=412755 RepID=A0A0F9R2U7_9ZZZZ
MKKNISAIVLAIIGWEIIRFASGGADVMGWGNWSLVLLGVLITQAGAVLWFHKNKQLHKEVKA